MMKRTLRKQLVPVQGRASKCLLCASLFFLLFFFLCEWKAVSVLDQHMQTEHHPSSSSLLHHPLPRQVPQQNPSQHSNQNTKDFEYEFSNLYDVSDKQRSLRAVTLSNDQTRVLPPPPNHDERRFLVFFGSEKGGQGAGNIMQGLLAAHLLALEFNRTLCVHWPSFSDAFEYADPQHEDLCQGAESWKLSYKFIIWNFISTAVNECHMRRVLSNAENTVLGFAGNTYPGWRSDIPPGFFHQHYRPKTALLNFLPYSKDNAPKEVVHLRAPDGEADSERGLDKESLQYLGEMLRGNGTYLVTNRPDWYRRFHDCCGWSYDTTWVNKPIYHGADSISWLPDGTQENSKDSDSTVKANQNLKLWSDWYTMLNAEKVYHSPSDFSRSAIHWNSDCMGYTLSGMRTVSKTIPMNTQKEDAHTNDLRNRKRARRNGVVRELILLPSYDPTKYIPPIVERQEPDSFRMDESCIFLRFCREFVQTKEEKIIQHLPGDMRQRIDNLTKRLMDSTKKVKMRLITNIHKKTIAHR